MATTTEQDKVFYFDMMNVIPLNLLMSAIRWIGDTLHPYDVFSYDQLERWAQENGFVKTK